MHRKTYRAVFTPQPHVDPEEWEVSLDRMEVIFTIRNKGKPHQTPESVVATTLSDMGVTDVMNYKVTEVAPDLVTPAMYRIRHQKLGGKIELESQMLLFDVTGEPGQRQLFFSARPVFGTQGPYRESDLISIERVADDAPVYVGWDPRKKGKPLTWKYER